MRDALRTNRGLISFGIAGAVIAASTGFGSLISALNVAYEVREQRPFWRKQMLALGLTIFVGLMVTVVLVMMVLGPEFGFWLASKFRVTFLFAASWPIVRWVVIMACTILAVEMIYFLAPNVKQRFLDQVPGAIVAVLSWIGASWILGWYLTSVANYQKTFGTLGAVVGLMLWFYITAIALITGAEINVELLRARKRSPLL